MSKKITKLNVLLLCLLIVAFFVIARNYYDSNYYKIENSYFDKYKADFPQNLNVQALKKINARLTSDSNFSFIVLGDSAEHYKKLRRVIKDASRHNPDFMVHTGDFTSHGTYHEYSEMLQVIQEVETPMLLTTGNHDTHYKGSEWFAHIFGPANFYADIGQYRFFFLNNTEEEVYSPILNLTHASSDLYDHRLIRGMDLKEIEDIETSLLQKHTNFIIMHAPLPIKPFKKRAFYRNADAFMKMLQRNNAFICRVFSGHIHTYDTINVAGIPCIVSGGAGDGLYKTHPTGKHHYILVTVEDGNVQHQVFFVE